MRRILLMISILIFISAAALADGYDIAAKGAIIIEASSGRAIYEKNADEMYPMASTTKIMTCLLAIENSSLDDIVTASATASGTTGTSLYLSKGEKLTMEQMLYGIMLRSGNDAAVAIAEHIAGSVDAFADMMNRRADEMDIDASFINPHGLDASGHKASARAMAMIMREAMNNPVFRRITATKEKVVPWEGNEYSRVLTNKNRLLTSYEGATGGKTGYTSKAGRCLVFSAKKRGMTLIGCVLNCSSWFDTAEMLLDYGFENFALETPYSAMDIVGRVAVNGGQEKFVNVIAAQSLSFPLGVNEKFYTVFDMPTAVDAPVSASEVCGSVNVYIDDKLAASAPLIYSSDVSKNDVVSAVKKVFMNWIVNR